MRDSIRWPFVMVMLMALTACDARTGAVPESGETAALQGISDPEAVVVVPAEDAVETQILDEQGFGAPMIAVRAQIPGDWSTRGGVTWDRRPDCVANHQRLHWIATSPDNRQAIELMPGLTWQVQGTDIQMNPCPPLAIRSTQEFLQVIAQRYPGARVISYRDRPELAPPSRQAENGARITGGAGELLIAYQNSANGGGAEIHELLTTSLMASELQGNVLVTSPVVYAYRVAGGEPDPAVVDRFINTMKADPQWMAQVQQTSSALIAQVSERQRNGIATWHANQMARINAGGAADRAAIRAQTNREVAQIYSNTWNNSQATDERIQRRTLESIGGYNTYADPANGGVVRESIEQDRVLRTEDGRYISTNDPYLNPAGSEELERVP
jgi:hypothetical protein